MRRYAVASAAACAALLAAAACVDLFHSTDVQPLDAVCATDAPTAEAWAEQTCAWLAACEDPIGRNATGACMVDALMAYNCTANPDRRPRGAVRDYWLCLRKAAAAQSCADVAACVFPDGPLTCGSGGFIGCSQSASTNASTRIECGAPGTARGENCAAYGQSCDSIDPTTTNNDALCVGPARRSCTQNGCTGTKLSLCDDAGVDHGYDCASFGAGTCVSTGAGPACGLDADAGSCAASNVVSCTAAGVAQGCASGVPESVDCTPISGAGSCTKIADGGPGVTPLDACHSGGCTGDACSAGKLVACVKGRRVAIDCAAAGLGPCSDSVATVEGARSACTAP